MPHTSTAASPAAPSRKSLRLAEGVTCSLRPHGDRSPRSLSALPHAREGEQEHDRQRDGPHYDLRERDVGGLDGEEENREEQAVDSRNDRLAQRIADENDGRAPARDKHQHDA